jgi:hypothetical protein
VIEHSEGKGGPMRVGSLPWSVVNRVDVCGKANTRKNRVADLAYLVIHRISLAQKADGNPDPIPDAMLSAVDIAEIFSDPKMGTGGLCPYHFLIRKDGTVEQMLPLLTRGAHSIGYNSKSIAISVAGDYRKERATQEMIGRVAAVCAHLIPINGGLRIVGHTQLPNASADAGKVCPGDGLHPYAISTRATMDMPQDWRRLGADLVKAGLIAKGYAWEAGSLSIA